MTNQLARQTEGRKKKKNRQTGSVEIETRAASSQWAMVLRIFY
jgi:hypothetical protein